MSQLKLFSFYFQAGGAELDEVQIIISKAGASGELSPGVKPTSPNLKMSACTQNPVSIIVPQWSPHIWLQDQDPIKVSTQLYCCCSGPWLQMSENQIWCGRTKLTAFLEGNKCSLASLISCWPSQFQYHCLPLQVYITQLQDLPPDITQALARWFQKHQNCLKNAALSQAT